MTDSIKIRNCADRIFFSEITHDMFCDHRLPNHGMMFVRSGVLRIETDGESIEAHAGDYVFWHRNCKATMKKCSDGDIPFRSFAPSYTGESGGEPRYVASPDINTEDFCAAVDFFATNDRVDPERIGILGICGWGGLALNAAANKELMIIPDAVHTDLYDNLKVIPFDKIIDFYMANLK